MVARGMPSFVRRLFEVNVPAGASIRERKTAVLGNWVILSLVFFNFVFLVVDEVLVQLGLIERFVSLVEAAFFLLCVLSWILHSRGHMRLGRMLFVGTGNLHAAFIALSFGPNSNAWWFLLGLFLVPLLLFPSRDWILIIVLMAFSVLLAVATEYHYRNYPRLLELSPDTERLLAYLNAFFVFTIVGLFVYAFFRATHEAEALLEEEQARSERLLLNVLPPSIARRLKADAGVIADQFDSVTVLFADIVGFTEFSRTVGPADLVDALNSLFSSFDDLARSHGAEKIKTIGDAYMVAAGIPEPVADHAGRIARMALDMQRAIRAWDEKYRLRLDLRIGIHSGSVVAGVIGKQKFSYDLWGDTVNTASRMESHGEPGRIHLSDATARLLDDQFRMTPRGTIEVKGMGRVPTSFLEGLL